MNCRGSRIEPCNIPSGIVNDIVERKNSPVWFWIILKPLTMLNLYEQVEGKTDHVYNISGNYTNQVGIDSSMTSLTVNTKSIA